MMFKRLIFAAVILGLFSLPALAQENGSGKDFGGDEFRSGWTVIIDRDGIDDLFAAGSTVNVRSDIAGSAYLAGRSISVSGAVADDVFAAGLDVTLTEPVKGDVTLAGNNITVQSVGGDLRATGGNVEIAGPVAGYAMLAGDKVQLSDHVNGDVYISARNIDFKDNAKVLGRLVLFEEKVGTVEVPESVAPEQSIERRDVSEWNDAVAEMASETWQGVVSSFLYGAAIVALLASITAAIIPEKLAKLRRGLLDRPLHNLWFGFLAESVAIGSAIIFAMTVLGILLIPASLLIALVVGFAGYVVAAYSVGVALSHLIGLSEPGSFASRFLAAAIGAVVVSAITMIPFIGWLIALALVLAGVGAITLMLFQPAFYVSRDQARLA